MSPRTKRSRTSTGWVALPDAEGQFSSGIADLDRLLGGGFRGGSFVVFGVDETVELEDLDAVLFPAILNGLYHSRGMLAVLPARDSPGSFRDRLTRFVTRRRFDARVRIIEYTGEAAGAPYVVHLRVPGSSHGPERAARDTAREVRKMVDAERVIQGERKKPYLELSAFEIPDMEVGPEVTARMVLHGVKRSKEIGNLVIGLLGPGVGASEAIRRIADSELQLHHDEVGLTVRGIRPTFPAHVVAPDELQGPPHAVLIPRPP